MARVGRLAGALLAESEGQYFLVGYTKEPCNFAAAGFESPVEPLEPDEGTDARRRPHVRLSVAGRVEMAPPWLVLGVEGEALARLLVERFLIERNGSVSERLWRLVTCDEGPSPEPWPGLSAGASSGSAPGAGPGAEIDARWLAEVPASVWRIVRETVLRCT